MSERARRRSRFVVLGLVLAALSAVGIIAYYTLRTSLRLDRLGKESVIEATLGLATEKANRLDRTIVDQDNAVVAIADPAELEDVRARWLSTAQRETPTIRAIVILDDTGAVMEFISRASGALREEDAFRRILVQRLLPEMNAAPGPSDELRHLHKDTNGQSYLVSYWRKVDNGQSYWVVAWHDIARIVRETFPKLYAFNAAEAKGNPHRLNVVDEEGRIVFGPPLRATEFTVGVRFPTTLYNWRVQVAPVSGDALAVSAQSRRTLEVVMIGVSCLVILAGLATLLYAIEKERKISEMKSEFVANVSHELKTPLALVRMFAEMLQSGRVTTEEKKSKYLDVIVAESERLSNLIENVLDFSRVERGKSEYMLEPGMVHEAVQRAVDTCRYRADRDQVELSLSAQEPHASALMDGQALSLAVINLIDNALKYASAGKKVMVTVQANTRTVEIRVADFGPGVPQEERARIFQRFVRGESHRKNTQTRGSGIGLAHVKHIAEGHAGRVWVEPNTNDIGTEVGACFVIALPTYRA